MDENLDKDYDVIVLGTGLTESLIAAGAARIGKKVLHIDRNSYYGGQWASFSLNSLEDWKNSIDQKSNKQGDHGDLVLDDTEIWKNLASPNSVYSKVQLNYLQTASEDQITDDKKTETKINDQSSIDASTQRLETETLPDETAQCKSKSTEPWTKEKLQEKSRKFNIDLAPKLLYSRGPMVELLISSNVARYLEFKCATRILTWMANDDIGTELVEVPCSRSDVFTTSVVNLIEKRLLMKFLQFCHRYQENTEQWKDFENKTFKEFLVNQKLTPTLIHFVINAIAMVNKDVSCEEGLVKTSLFLQSLGRYGTMPFLFSLYGSGEMPQAFCRLCAVFEGIYMLRKDVEGLIMDEQNHVVSVVTEGQRFKCKNIVMEAGYLPTEMVTQSLTSSSISRAVFVTDRSILSSSKESVTLLRMPAENQTPEVTVIELNYATGVCPNDTFLVHLTCEGKDASVDLRSTVEKLFNTNNGSPLDATEKPNPLLSFYFNRNVAPVGSNLPANLFVCSGPDAQLDYDTAISQARQIFHSIYPDETFLPRAPDPEEIVFEGESAKQDDTFSQEPMDTQEDSSSAPPSSGSNDADNIEMKDSTNSDEGSPKDADVS